MWIKGAALDCEVNEVHSRGCYRAIFSVVVYRNKSLTFRNEQ